MKTDLAWLKTRQQLLERLKAQVNSRLGPPSAELKSYTRKFRSQLPSRWQRSEKKLLLQRMQKADFVFASDFHAYSQSQRVHLRLLRQLIQIRPDLILYCEFLESKHQKWIDQYQNGQLAEKAFLSKIKFHQAWGFPWEAYRVLLDFARLHQIPVIGTNHLGLSLSKRDEWAARVIAKTHKPQCLHYIVFGELHLAPAHLPQKLRLSLNTKKLNSVTIYQDEERLYFKLARQGLENQIDVMRAKGDVFCVLGTPPWVRWQSYAMFLEQTFDQDLNEKEQLDLSDHFCNMVDLLARDLQVRVDPKEVSVYSNNQNQMWQQLKSSLKRNDLKKVRFLVETNRSFYLPQLKLAYISQLSVNHMADVAGRYIHARLNGLKRWPVNVPKDFKALIWMEAVGFFASKLINHKRAADTLFDLRAQLGSLSQKSSPLKEVLALALDQRTREVLNAKGLKRRQARFKAKSKTSELEAARLLGSMMGERLYQSYRQRWLSRRELLKWLKMDPSHLEFQSQYDEIVRKLEPGERLEKPRAERL